MNRLRTLAATGLQQATGLSDTATQAGISSSSSLTDVIGSLIKALMGGLGVLFVVLLLYAGFIYFTSQGAPDKMKKAKDLIRDAVIGLVIVFASYSVAAYVIDLITATQDNAGALHSGATGATAGQSQNPEDEVLPPCPPDDPLCNVSQ
ncbi:MAG: Type secretion system pilin [Candidatus Parcubacteria bacterium]|jgi:hypothetical protein